MPFSRFTKSALPMTTLIAGAVVISDAIGLIQLASRVSTGLLAVAVLAAIVTLCLLIDRANAAEDAGDRSRATWPEPHVTRPTTSAAASLVPRLNDAGLLEEAERLTTLYQHHAALVSSTKTLFAPRELAAIRYHHLGNSLVQESEACVLRALEIHEARVTEDASPDAALPGNVVETLNTAIEAMDEAVDKLTAATSRSDNEVRAFAAELNRVSDRASRLVEV